MNLSTSETKDPEKVLKSLYSNASKIFEIGDYDTFKFDMQNDEDKLHKFDVAMANYYDMPLFDQLKADIGFIEKKKEDDTSGEDLQLPSYQTLTDYITESVDGKTPEFGPESITYKIPKWAKSARLKELEEKQFSPEQVQAIKDTYYDLDTPKKLDSISKLIDQDFAILDDGIKNANQINSYLQDEEKRIEQQTELLGDQPYPEKLNRQIEEYNKIIEENKAADNKMKQFKDQLEAKVFSIEAATANILSEKSKEGSPLGAMYNSFMKGVGSEASGAVDLMIDGMTYFSPRNGLSPKEYDRLKSEGKSEDEILDYARKYSKKQLLPDIRKGALELAGVSSTTQEYMNKWEETFFGGAFSGLAQSIPALIGNKYTRILNFGLQASDAVSKEMENNPDFDGISETEKYAVKLPIAVINGLLENYGFRNIVNGSTLTKTVLSNILKTKSKKITAKTFTELADREIKSLLAKGAVRIGTGGLAEFETGALQEISDVTVKYLYNGVKDKKMFESPESLTDFASQVLRSGAQEAIGGFVMATVPAALNGIRERKGYKLEQKLFDIVDDYVQNPEHIAFHEMQQRIALKKGSITQEEYDSNIKNLNYFKSISSKIPKNISPEGRKESFDLLRERESLNEQKKGVDESMTAPFEERITEINNRLTEISKTAKTETQQEQQPERKKKTPGRKRSYKKGMSPSSIDRESFGTDKESKNKVDLIERADNAEAALKDVGDGTRVFVYETQEDMISSVPEADTDTKAIYVSKDNTIHMALDVATNDDVGHEAFHSAVLNAIKSDTELQALTKRMLDAVLTTKEGKEIYSDIQDLLTNYDEFVQNEEALANILGRLSANYNTLTPSVKTQILQWINSVAKKLNLGTVFTDAATDAEVIDILNRFQQKVTQGKRVDTKELEVLSEKINERAKPTGNKVNNLKDKPRKSKLTKEEQKSLDRGNSIRKKNDQALRDTKVGFRTKMVKFLKNVFGEQLTDSQASIKRIYEGYDTLSKQNRVLNKIVNIAGAKGYATDVFQEYEEEILGGLKKTEISLLEMIVLSRRIIEINKNKSSRDGEKFKEYTGTDGYNTKESEAYLKSLSKNNPELFKKLNDRASKYFDMSRQMLKEMYDGGLLTSESYESIRQLEYMPIKTLKFVLENETENWSEDDIDSFSEKLGISSNGIMTLTENNERNIVQDLRYMMMLQVNMTKFRVAQNELLNAVYDDYVSRENKEDFNEFILDNPVIGKKTTGALKFKYDDTKIPLGYKQISFFKNGIKYKMVMKTEARNQLLNLKAKSLSPTWKSLLRLGSFSPVLRFFATAANPLFVLSNIPMDYQNILLNSNTYGRSALFGSLPLAKDFTLNFLRKVANTGEYRRIKREYFENGGKMLFMAEQANLTQKDIDKAKKFAKPLYSLVNYYGKAFGYLGDASELAFRLAVYEKTKSKEINKFKKENGKLPSPEQLQDIKETATREAREVMDYNQGGTFSKSLDLVMPYTNASFLGLRRFYDGFRKNPKIFASKVVEMMTASAILHTGSLAMAMLAFDGDEEEKKRKLKDALKGLSEYERANYIVMFTGNKNKKGELEYYRIRKLPLLNVAFSISEQKVEQVMLGKEFDYSQSFKALRWSVPFFGGGRVESTVPILASGRALFDNKDVFYDQDIWRGPKDIPEYKKGLYDEKVEGIYKQIGEKMNLSPKKLKVAMEKIVTTPTTNPGLAIFYSVANGIVTKESDELKNLPKMLGENSLKKFKRYTNSNLKRYEAKEQMTDQLIKAKGDEYSKDQEIKMMIRDEMSKEKPNYKSFISKLESEIIKKYPADKYNQENKRQRFVKYINMEQNAEKGAQRVPYEVIDLFYEREIELQLVHLKYIYDNVSGGDQKEFVRYMNNASSLLNKKIPAKAIKVFLRDYK